MRVFGCPAYVLTKEMQDGNATGKFSKQKSYLGVFIGFSDAHDGNVLLIFNPKTKLVSPQYHVIFDKDFDTAFTNNTKELQEKIFQSITHFGENSEEWIFVDKFDNNPSCRFFDSSWDIDAIEEDIVARKKCVKQVLVTNIIHYFDRSLAL